METLLRKYLWAIDLLVIAICAVFSARATATMIQTRITRMTAAGQERAAHGHDRASVGTYYGKEVEAILKRNIFCSTCPPILGRQSRPVAGRHRRPKCSGRRCRCGCSR